MESKQMNDNEVKRVFPDGIARCKYKHTNKHTNKQTLLLNRGLLLK